MNQEKPSNAANQLPKLGILEEDDEFEEFPIESSSVLSLTKILFGFMVDWDVTGEMKLDVEQWEVDWDDDNVDDEFSVQLR